MRKNTIIPKSNVKPEAPVSPHPRITKIIRANRHAGRLKPIRHLQNNHLTRPEMAAQGRHDGGEWRSRIPGMSVVARDADPRPSRRLWLYGAYPPWRRRLVLPEGLSLSGISNNDEPNTVIPEAPGLSGISNSRKNCFKSVFNVFFYNLALKQLCCFLYYIFCCSCAIVKAKLIALAFFYYLNQFGEILQTEIGEL